jgi:hypothetical protein
MIPPSYYYPELVMNNQGACTPENEGLFIDLTDLLALYLVPCIQ